MKINILCIGNIKEKFYTQACNEYIKRLSKYHNVNIIELEEEKIAKNASIADIAKVKVKESLKFEKYLKGYNIVLDVNGKSLDSVAFAKKIEQISQNSFIINFIIGGSYGLSDEIKNKADMLLSFSSFTFPHQLMRVVLLEQIYRATTISNNITYHK
ncbi:MAG: 23S rRNA (pseudouridine(1915)-N(3))-methyltransferase RlmH [Clostridiales bacterium]|nr:23S rRNA (pseudouridine(1915)-N(3))-methyltransferase RlmH [Clostridiales bacterium]